MATLNQKIQQHLDALPGDQVKAAVRRWLNNSDIDLAKLEQSLAEEQEAIAAFDAIMESDDFRKEFPYLTEEEQIQRSLRAHAEYEQVGGTPHAEIKAWIKSLRA
jgi:paraquat-inducible protein B